MQEELMSRMSPVVHFEMPAENRKRMAAFYEKAFGWKTELLGPEMGDYVLVTTAVSDAKPGAPAGAINGGFFPKKPDWPAQYPSIVIGVDDIEAAMRRVGKEGGEVLGEPMQIPGVGRYISFFDTERNRVSMLQPEVA
jgi:predicted enzyme related to lactoylglutathione lyase